MSNQQQSFHQRIASLHPDSIASLTGIRHGVERETLRVTAKGQLAVSGHPQALGSALKHEWITTDFSESLMEFITPPETNVNTTINQLCDIHKFVYSNINEELLWPLSMPCFIDASTRIPIARYGRSNIARMKEVYRSGLHHRYGSMMQVIAGVHLNFSLPDEFWNHWFATQGHKDTNYSRSTEYFALIRNFRKIAWVVPYLFGASPALCGSFVAHSQPPHDFKKLGKGTLYLPNSTSLRMSDLGYTSSAQSALRICYNDLDSYVTSVRQAINLPSTKYAHISAGQNGRWDQLNTNTLQIENELYAPIRPKQVARYLEKPTDALADRGVSYIEVRGLDVNPFSQVGIDAQQIRFMDALLLYCLLKPSPQHSDADQAEFRENLNRVVLNGRSASLTVIIDTKEVPLSKALTTIFDEILICAELLDTAHQCDLYTTSVLVEFKKVQDPSLTFSGQMLATLLENGIDNSCFGLELAKEYRRFIEQVEYQQISEEMFRQASLQSLHEQTMLEKSDTVDFATFVDNYFAASR